MVRGASYTICFDFNDITEVGWFGFRQELVGKPNGNNFESYTLFDL